MNEEERESKGWSGYLLWFALVVALYVLSIGPAALINQKSKSSTVDRAFNIIYLPMKPLLDTPLEQPLIWWIELWVGPIPYK